MNFKEVKMCLLRGGDQADEYGVFKEYDNGYAIPEWSRYRPRSDDLLGTTLIGIADGQCLEGNHEGADGKTIKTNRERE